VIEEHMATRTRAGLFDVSHMGEIWAEGPDAIEFVNRLTTNDPPLPFPHSSQIEGQLRELRCHYGRDLYRILYQRSGNLFVLLHALAKRTGAPPEADIELAKSRFEDFRRRMDAQPRRRPRAAGHDAP